MPKTRGCPKRCDSDSCSWKRSGLWKCCGVRSGRCSPADSSSWKSSLRTADAFPVAASLPSFSFLWGVLFCSASENKQKSCVHLLVYEHSFPSVIRFPFFKGACNLLPPPEMEENARLLKWTINCYSQIIKASTQRLPLDLSRKPIIYNEYNSNKLAAKDREDIKGDAGVDLVQKGIAGRDACQLYRSFLFFWEFYKNNTKF